MRDLVEALAQSWGPRCWHGTGLAAAVRGVAPRVALWRPGPSRHNIWELVLHLAYWKYMVNRRLTGSRSGRFPHPGSNWPLLTDTSPAAWDADRRLLAQAHAILVDTVMDFPARRLDQKVGRWTAREMILGIAAHDAYHTGQIQLLKRLSTRT